MNLAATLPWLGAKPLADLDLVLLVLSMNDAVRLTPVDTYRRDMERLLDKVSRETKPSARIVVAGIQPVRSFPSYRGVFGALGQKNADRLNAATREVVGRFEGASFMDLQAPTPEPARPYGSPQMYADWAESFADVCSTSLDETRAVESRRPMVLPEPERAWDWQPGKHIIDSAPKGGWHELEQLVGEAKREFGVDLAFVSLLDGDRQYYAATTGPSPKSVPRELTHCDVTVQGTEPLIVKNSQKDERFKHSPLIDLTQMQFYAGVPLQDAAGENIGTFCVMSAFSKSPRLVSDGALREFAARAQEELQRIAQESGATTERADAGSDGGVTTA